MDMPPELRRARLARRRGERGQAMVEYSMINWILILALVLGISVPISNHKNTVEVFLDAYRIYYDSFYFTLNLPFP
jgi:hypothetical protein